MSDISPQQDAGKSSFPIRAFLLGLLLGIILVVALAMAIPEKTSPAEFVQSGWEKMFPPPGNAEFLAENAKQSGVKQTASGLQYKIINSGKGPSPTATDTALVKYEGMLREYRIWIPSDLAYGEASPGELVPSNSLLIFDVTLLDFISQAQMEELRQQMQGAAGGPPSAP